MIKHISYCTARMTRKPNSFQCLIDYVDQVEATLIGAYIRHDYLEYIKNIL